MGVPEREVHLSLRSKREYVEAILLRYKHASRQEKKIVLDEFVQRWSIIESMRYAEGVYALHPTEAQAERKVAHAPVMLTYPGQTPRRS